MLRLTGISPKFNCCTRYSRSRECASLGSWAFAKALQPRATSSSTPHSRSAGCFINGACSTQSTEKLANSVSSWLNLLQSRRKTSCSGAGGSLAMQSVIREPPSLSVTSGCLRGSATACHCSCRPNEQLESWRQILEDRGQCNLPNDMSQ